MDTYGAIRPLLLISFMIGISPFKTVGSPGNRHLETSFIGVANTVIHLVLFISCYVLLVSDERSLMAHFFHSKISRFGEDLQILTSFTALTFALVSCYFKRNKLCKLLKVTDEIDKKLTYLGAVLNHKTISRAILFAIFILSMLLLVFIGTIVVVVSSTQDQPDFLEWIFFFLPMGIIMTLKLKFYCSMQLIKYRLRFLNLILRKLQRDQSDPFAYENEEHMELYKCCGITIDVMKLNGDATVKRDIYDIIGELCQIHNEICNASYLVEGYFSHQMLTTITIEFVCSLFNLYFIFEVAYHNTIIAKVGKIEFICYFAFHTTMSLGMVYYLLRSAESVTAEVSSFVSLFFDKSQRSCFRMNCARSLSINY